MKEPRHSVWEAATGFLRRVSHGERTRSSSVAQSRARRNRKILRRNRVKQL